MNINFNFENHVLWEKCSDEHKKTLKVPSIFGHVLYEFYEKIPRLKNIKNAIETGTFDARTSIFFANIFETVETIELYDSINPYNGKSFKETYEEIKRQYLNIKFYFDTSPNALKNILINNPFVNYFILLDAHAPDSTPLINELKAIRDYSKTKDHVIMIDDCCYFGNGIYPEKKEVNDLLLQINNSYNIVKTSYGNEITIAF